MSRSISRLRFSMKQSDEDLQSITDDHEFSDVEPGLCALANSAKSVYEALMRLVASAMDSEIEGNASTSTVEMALALTAGQIAQSMLTMCRELQRDRQTEKQAYSVLLNFTLSTSDSLQFCGASLCESTDETMRHFGQLCLESHAQGRRFTTSA